jgi:hypothetical protein
VNNRPLVARSDGYISAVINSMKTATSNFGMEAMLVTFNSRPSCLTHGLIKYNYDVYIRRIQNKIVATVPGTLIS